MLNNVDYFVQFDFSYDVRTLAITFVTFALYRTFLHNNFQNYSKWRAGFNERQLAI